MSKQRSEPFDIAGQLAARRKFRRTRTPESMRRIRDALAVGPMGGGLGLDHVPGVTWVRVTDHGSLGPCVMPEGQVLVEVWGGDHRLAFASIRHRTPAGVMIVVLWRPATWWQRLKRWGSFTSWRIARALGDS